MLATDSQAMDCLKERQVECNRNELGETSCLPIELLSAIQGVDKFLGCDRQMEMLFKTSC